MFESLKSFRQEPTEECEECLHKSFLVDAIIDGKQKRICQRCVMASGAIILRKPNPIQLEAMNRPSVREAIFRASGMMPKPLQASSAQVKLEDLRERYEETKKKKQEEQIKKLALMPEPETKERKMKVLDEKEFVNYIETLPKEITAPTAIATSPATEKKVEKPDVLDFSLEATRKTRIRDLLEKMKKMDEEAEAKEKAKEAGLREEKREGEKKGEEEEKPLEEIQFKETDI